jgi:hypothetical protein
MNEERTGKCLRQVEHIRGHLWTTNYVNIFVKFTCGAGTAYLSWGSEFSLGFFLLDSCYWISSFMCMFCRSFFVLLYFSYWPLCLDWCIHYDWYTWLIHTLWLIHLIDTYTMTDTTLLMKQHFVSTIDPWSNKLVILRNEKHFVYIALLMTIIWWNWTHFRCIVTIYRYK